MVAFLLTWKKTGWPLENIERMVSAFEQQGHVDEDWRLRSHKLAKPDDRVWALKQGFSPRVIFGAGKIIEAPSKGEAGNGKIQWMAKIRFEAFVNPLRELLIDEEEVVKILDQSQIYAHASGDPLRPEQSLAFERLFLYR